MMRAISITVLCMLQLACVMRGQQFDTEARTVTATNQVCVKEDPTNGTDTYCFQAFANLAGPSVAFVGDYFQIPRRASSPNDSGGAIVLQGDVLNNVDYNIDSFQGHMRMYMNSASTYEIQMSNIGAGDLDLNVGGDIVPAVTNTTDLGRTSRVWRNIHGDTIYGEVYKFQLPGAASHEYTIIRLSANVWSMRDALNNEVWAWDSQSARKHNSSMLHLHPGPYNGIGPSLVDLGATNARWVTAYVKTLDADTAILPTTNGNLALGSASLTWDAFLDDVRVSGDISADLAGTYQIGSIGTPFGSVFADSLVSGRAGVASGSLSIASLGGAGLTLLTAERLSGATDFSFSDHAYPTTTNTYDLGWGSGTIRRWRNVWATNVDVSGAYYGASGVAGTSATLACAAGQAIKNITVSSGIVTAVSCGAP